MAEYDSIAADYKKSKFAPWRVNVEVPSVFGLLGDVRGLRVLDLACGDGIYSRRIRSSGAARVVGVDLSQGMIDLARAEEASRPLGIDYITGAAQDLALGERFDVVFAAYLLNYAKSLDELAAFASAASRHLAPDGRFVGINNNPAHAPGLYEATRPFGFVKSLAPGARLENGTAITYTFHQDGRAFSFDNFYLHADDHAPVLAREGLDDFRWHPLRVASDADPSVDWDGFRKTEPVLCFSAVRRG